MPRKKEKVKLVTYCMPIGSKARIDSLVDASTSYNNKPVWKQKFYHLADYVADQNISLELNPEKEYVNINEAISAKILGVNNQEVATILRDTISSDLFKCDGISYRATTAKQGKKTVYLTDGKSRGFQFQEWNTLEEVTIADSRSTYERAFINSKEIFLKYDKSLKDYYNVLTKIKIEEDDINKTLSEIFKAKRKKKSQKENYRKLIKNFKNNVKPNNNIQHYTIPLYGAFVPVKNSEVLSMVPSYLNNFEHGAFVPCQPTKLELRRFNELDLDEVKAIIARCTRSVFIINGGYLIPTRPLKGSRVYNAITNLKRELRTAMRLDGRKIVGLDIANSQPLIATILIQEYWMNKQGYLPDDVKLYQVDCETGQFYNNFMSVINVPDDLRPLFKANFFAMVFFGEVTTWAHVLKDLFIKRYPNCWEAICDIKGDDYTKFSKKLQKKEAEIIFDKVNMGLIRQGILAFNIFDSIYVNNRHDFEIAKRRTKEAFNEYGLNPTLKLEYEEHLTESEKLEVEKQDLPIAIVNFITKSEESASDGPDDGKEPVSPVQVTKLQHLKIGNREDSKTDQIDKLWLSIQDDDHTVAVLLLSKKRNQETNSPDGRPSKLQHLKQGNGSKMEQMNRNSQGIQEQDAEEQAQVKPVMSNKEIYDFVVESLKSDGHPVMKENVDELPQVVKELMGGEGKNDEKPEEKQPYKFENPYVKRFSAR
jgi:hypothetical protein